MHRRIAPLLALAAAFVVPAVARADTAPSCGRLALALVVDRSGSMTGQPLDNAKAAASAAVDRLGANDCVTVVAFDSAPTTVVALHPLNDPGAVKAAIARIQAGGGTEIASALDVAHKSILTATAARKKHVLLLTDGQSPTAGLQQLAQTMNTEHMTISTVGFGSSTDEQTLKMLASTTSGRYYRVMDVTALAGIFSREVDKVLAP